MYDVGLAYFFWVIGGLGVLGFHRFYLGKVGTGLLWLFTGGLGGFGAFIDLFRIPSLVHEANLRIRYEQVLLQDRPQTANRVSYAENRRNKKEPLEKTILKTAKSNRGVATPGEVALQADIPVDEAQKALEKLAAGGFCEMLIRDTGVIVYYFAEFAEPDSTDPGGLS